MKSKDMSRRQFLRQASAGAVAAPVLSGVVGGLGSAAGTSNEAKPGFPAIRGNASRRRNVLFISTDDCCSRLGIYDNYAYGNPIKTPNLDRLGKSSVRFGHAYCQYAWCSPSRSSLMTGLAPDTTKVYDLQTHFREALPEVVTLPQTFINNGYFTARSGKIYHYGNPDQIGTSGLDDPPSWNETANSAGVDHVKEEALLTHITPQNLRFAKRWDEGKIGAPGCGPECWPGQGDPIGAHVPGGGGLGACIAMHSSTSGQELHTDYLVADAAIAMLENRRRQPDDPWFIGVGFYKPHVPWIVPSQYFDMYPLEDIRATPFKPDEMHIAPEWAYNTKKANLGMSVRERREAIQAYYAAASFVDANVGRVVEALHRLGLAENTTIVFWADHGWQLGEHGQWEKQSLFEAATRVPLMIGGAGVEAIGRTCSRTVEHLDIYPTLVEMCGLSGSPSTLQGQSLVPLLSNPDAAWGRPAVSQIYRRPGSFKNLPLGGIMGYSIRTERYRYTFWKQGSEGEELYDYQSDPRELHNLADDSRAASLKERLRAKLEEISGKRGMASAPGALKDS